MTIKDLRTSIDQMFSLLQSKSELGDHGQTTDAYDHVLVLKVVVGTKTWTCRDVGVPRLLVQIEPIKKHTVFDPDLTETLIQGVGIVCIHGESIYSFIQKNIKKLL